MDFLFPEFDDDLKLLELRKLWRYQAMARLPVYTANYWRKDYIGYIYRFDNKGCKFCNFLPAFKLGKK